MRNWFFLLLLESSILSVEIVWTLGPSPSIPSLCVAIAIDRTLPVNPLLRFSLSLFQVVIVRTWVVILSFDRTWVSLCLMNCPGILKHEYHILCFWLSILKTNLFCVSHKHVYYVHVYERKLIIFVLICSWLFLFWKKSDSINCKDCRFNWFESSFHNSILCNTFGAFNSNFWNHILFLVCCIQVCLIRL